MKEGTAELQGTSVELGGGRSNGGERLLPLGFRSSPREEENEGEEEQQGS
jgi:hypothetical protein